LRSAPEPKRFFCEGGGVVIPLFLQTVRRRSCFFADREPSSLLWNLFPSEVKRYLEVEGTEDANGPRGELRRVSTSRERSVMTGDRFGADIGDRRVLGEVDGEEMKMESFGSWRRRWSWRWRGLTKRSGAYSIVCWTFDLPYAQVSATRSHFN
jgi:hypothetical protein